MHTEIVYCWDCMNSINWLLCSKYINFTKHYPFVTRLMYLSYGLYNISSICLPIFSPNQPLSWFRRANGTSHKISSVAQLKQSRSTKYYQNQSLKYHPGVATIYISSLICNNRNMNAWLAWNQYAATSKYWSHHQQAKETWLLCLSQYVHSTLCNTDNNDINYLVAKGEEHHNG